MGVEVYCPHVLSFELPFGSPWYIMSARVFKLNIHLVRGWNVHVGGANSGYIKTK